MNDSDTCCVNHTNGQMGHRGPTLDHETRVTSLFAIDFNRRSRAGPRSAVRRVGLGEPFLSYTRPRVTRNNGHVSTFCP